MTSGRRRPGTGAVTLTLVVVVDQNGQTNGPDPSSHAPHGFNVGTIAAARASLAQWSHHNEQAACIFCGAI